MRYAVIGQQLPVNLTFYTFWLFAIGRVKCSQRPIGVNDVVVIQMYWPSCQRR